MKSPAFLAKWTIDPSKIPKYSEFKKELNEVIDKKLCDLILEYKTDAWTKKHKRTDEDIMPEITKLINLKKELVKNNNAVKYYQKNGMGRFYGNTFTRLTKKMKHTLFSYANMVDIDQHKGHPRIAVGLGELNDVDFPTMKEYIENDDKIFREMADWYGIDIDDAEKGSQNKDRLKWFFNMSIYGGGYKKEEWMEGDEDNSWLNGIINPSEDDILKGKLPLELKTHEQMPFMKAFKEECDLLKELIWKSNPLMKEVLSKDEEYVKKKEYKKKNCLVSYFMQVIENDALFHAYKYLKKNGIIDPLIVSLEYDGLCFPPKRPITDDDMKGLNEYVREKTCFPILYKLKPYKAENIYDDLIALRDDMDDEEEEEEEEEEVVEDEDNYEDEYDKKYRIVKEEWEKTCTKIKGEDLYFIYTDEYSAYKVKSKTQLIATYGYMNYGYYTKWVGRGKQKREVENKAKPRKFITRWLDDEEIKQAEGYGMYPPPLQVPKGHINMWFKFPFDDNKEFPYNTEAVEKINGMIMKLCDNDEKVFNFFNRWLGAMFQRPADKHGLFPIFVSDEGIGKGTLNKIIKVLVGSEKYMETSQPENHVWGRFNSLMGKAYFIVINEFGKLNQKEAEGRIKNILTDEFMVIKGEGDKPYNVDSYHHFIGGTNNTDPTTTKKGDRRKWLIMCSNELKGNKEFWVEMNALIKDENAMRSYFQYLMSVEIGNLFEESPPITEYQEILQESNEDVIEMFMKSMGEYYYKHGYTGDDKTSTESEYGDDDEDEDDELYYCIKRKYTAQDLYREFKCFKEHIHLHNYECNTITLMKKLQVWNKQNNKGIITKKKISVSYTIIDFEKLVSHYEINVINTPLPTGECLINL